MGGLGRVAGRGPYGGRRLLPSLPPADRRSRHAPGLLRRTRDAARDGRLESPPVAYDFHIPAAEGAQAEIEARPRAGPGRVTGRVLDARSEKPVEEAMITLRRAGGPQAGAETGAEGDPDAPSPPLQGLTNAQGYFLIHDVPGGTYGLELRHVAYGTVHEPIQVYTDHTLEVDLRVPPVAIELEPIVVTTVRDRRLEIKGFYERKRWGERLGTGHFITREEIERRHPASISSMIAEVLRTPRGAFCRAPKVLVDGIENADIPFTAEIGGVEIYKGPASTPAEFTGLGANCGVVVIWTRGR